MAHWPKALVAALGAVTLAAGATVSAGAHEGDTLVSFDSMTPVTGAAVGAVNDRGITGGGKPWVIASGAGRVDRQGHVHVTVTGLVIPVAPLNGTNPIPQFKATLSCLTPHGIVNVSTGLFDATPAGDSTIDGTVSLPHPCWRPIVFVGNAGGAWFAMSNAGERSQDDEDGH
jgi:hypothetical protein